MFDRLEDILIKLEEIMHRLNDQSTINDSKTFQRLLKEQAELQPIADTYNSYKRCNETIEESLEMLGDENDDEMREMLKEELQEAKKQKEELEHELK